MSVGCGHDHNVTFDGTNSRYRRVLALVIAANAAMFLLEMVAGHTAGSKALQADALDFLADSLTFGLALAVIGRPLAVRARVATMKGFSLVLMALWVVGSTLWQAALGGLPAPAVMGGVGLLALATNVLSVLLLRRYQHGDANVRAVWLCARNDAIGNVAVLLAALAVAGLHSRWPDVLVALGMGSLFLVSAIRIVRQARQETADPHHQHAHGGSHAHHH